MASNPDGNGVILIGGLSTPYPHPEFSNSILELKLKADGVGGWVGSWTVLTAKLQYPRSDHVVIPIFMEKEYCKLNGKMSLDTTNGDNTNHGNVKNGR